MSIYICVYMKEKLFILVSSTLIGYNVFSFITHPTAMDNTPGYLEKCFLINS